MNKLTALLSSCLAILAMAAVVVPASASASTVQVCDPTSHCNLNGPFFCFGGGGPPCEWQYITEPPEEVDRVAR